MNERHNDLSQKIDNLQYSISRLINLNTEREKGNFPSQPYQNPKGFHKVEAKNGETSMVRKVKVVMVDQPIFKPKHDEGLPEPSEKLANLSPWMRRKEMQPLLNAVEIQRHAKEEPPKLILNPLPSEMKYAYRVEDKLKEDHFFYGLTWWAIKTLNMDLNKAGMKRFLNLNEREELRNDAYINSNIAKQRLKKWHIGPFTIQQVYSNGVVELLNSTRSFKFNGQRLKPFLEPFSQDKEEINLLEPNQA
ncbi:hypothetical protein AAG906_037936 [Vitis piasezkii]